MLQWLVNHLTLPFPSLLLSLFLFTFTFFWPKSPVVLSYLLNFSRSLLACFVDLCCITFVYFAHPFKLHNPAGVGSQGTKVTMFAKLVAIATTGIAAVHACYPAVSFLPTSLSRGMRVQRMKSLTDMTKTDTTNNQPLLLPNDGQLPDYGPAIQHPVG